MNSNISIGDLALKLGTSRKRLGQIIRVNDIEVTTKKVRDVMGRYHYTKAVTGENAKRIQSLLPNFNPPKENRAKKYKSFEITEVENISDYTGGIIISQDFKTGQSRGQGIREWWRREREKSDGLHSRVSDRIGGRVIDRGVNHRVVGEYYT